MVKLRLQTDRTDDIHHRFELKLGVADEVSSASYIGLNISDFRETPYRRYRATGLDRFDWERIQLQASYGLFLFRALEARLTAYRHDTAGGFRLNSFGDPQSPRAVLRGESSVDRIGVLRGTKASADFGNVGLLRARNNDSVT